MATVIDLDVISLCLFCSAAEANRGVKEIDTGGVSGSIAHPLPPLPPTPPTTGQICPMPMPPSGLSRAASGNDSNQDDGIMLASQTNKNFRLICNRRWHHWGVDFTACLTSPKNKRVNQRKPIGRLVGERDTSRAQVDWQETRHWQ